MNLKIKYTFFSIILSFILLNTFAQLSNPYIQQGNFLFEPFIGRISSGLWQLPQNDESFEQGTFFLNSSLNFETVYGTEFIKTSAVNSINRGGAISLCVVDWENQNKKNRAFILGIGAYYSVTEVMFTENYINSNFSYSGYFNQSTSLLFLKTELLVPNSEKFNFYFFANPGLNISSYDYSSTNVNFNSMVSSKLNQINNIWELRFGVGFRLKLDNRLGLNFQLATRPLPWEFDNKNAILGTSSLFAGLTWVMGPNKRDLITRNDAEKQFEDKYIRKKQEFNEMLDSKNDEINSLVEKKEELENQLTSNEEKISNLETKVNDKPDAYSSTVNVKFESKSSKQNKTSKTTKSSSSSSCEIDNITIIDPADRTSESNLAGNGAIEVNLLDNELINYDFNGFEFIIDKKLNEKNVTYDVVWKDGFTENSNTVIDKISGTNKLIKIDNIVEDYDKIVLEIYKYCKSSKSELFVVSFIPK